MAKGSPFNADRNEWPTSYSRAEFEGSFILWHELGQVAIQMLV